MSEAASTRTPLCIPATHPSLPGHFPGQPVVPGVVILDAVQRAIEAASGELPALKLPQVKCMQPLLPGEDALIEIDATATGRWRFRVLRGDTLIASGEIAAA